MLWCGYVGLSERCSAMGASRDRVCPVVSGLTPVCGFGESVPRVVGRLTIVDVKQPSFNWRLYWGVRDVAIEHFKGRVCPDQRGVDLYKKTGIFYDHLNITDGDSSTSAKSNTGDVE